MTKIKNVFEEHINKEEIKEIVLNERKSFVFKPVYAMCLLLIGLLILPTNINKGNKVLINTVNGIGTQDMDIKVMLQPSYNSVIMHENYPFLKELEKEYDWNLYYVYVKDKKNDYTQLHDEVFEFKNKDKKIEIRISSIKDPLKDTIIETNKNKTSIIEGVSMKIYQYDELYFVSFKHNDQYYYVETAYLDSDEFVDVLTLLV